MIETDAAPLFDALASAPRLRVLRQLVQAGSEGLSAGKLTDALNVSPSALSFHLSTLTERDLITQEKQARSRIYRINFNKLGELVQFLLEDCCQNDPKMLRCCAPQTRAC
ncbi:MAG: helix-turn-helix transcriptional regulator [Paracoccaceae bacterium]|jgi:ArsR family transcriptional regulator, arsenate/arsenite/antimonite-responsive transcriptional repressor|nr:helix-turn-helix transcriptional regulator [Paracoccaceae bacterium]